MQAHPSEHRPTTANVGPPNSTTTATIASVLKSGPVRFFASKIGNRQPQPVLKFLNFQKTGLQPTMTGLNRFGIGWQPVWTKLGCNRLLDQSGPVFSLIFLCI